MVGRGFLVPGMCGKLNENSSPYNSDSLGDLSLRNGEPQQSIRTRMLNSDLGSLGKDAEDNDDMLQKSNGTGST